MLYSSQEGVAPSRRTMGVIKMEPKTVSTAPSAKAEKKAVDST